MRVRMLRRAPRWWPHVLVVFALVLAALAEKPAYAQVKVPILAATTPATKTTEEDEPAFDSPRASMSRFFAATNDGRFADAARYLELAKADTDKGPELARMLDVVLARKLLVDPNELSPLATGRRDDGLPAGVDEIGRITGKDGKVIPIRIVRREAKGADEEARWIFSAQTVGQAPILYDALGERWAREHFPPFFFYELPRSFLLWHAAAVALVLLVSYLVAYPLAWVLVAIVGRLAKHWKLAWDDHARRHMIGPARTAWVVPLTWFGTRFVGLYQPAEATLVRALKALVMVALFWFLLRLVASFGGSVLESDWGRRRPSLRGFSAFSLRVSRFVVWFFGAVAVANELGYPVGSIITGLGIGGIAIALAAQKTVENLFGSLSILVDQPFRVGDTIRVDGIEGAVETVGLRSTRIRTSDRSLVVIPNGKLADMRIESLSARDRTRFATKLRILPKATHEQIEAFVGAVSEALARHPKVRREDVVVRLAGMADGVLEVEVAGSVETTKFAEFADARQELLLLCLAAARKSGVEIAPRDAAAASTATG